MKTRFIVVRHGQTEWNVAERIQGHSDSPLTELGLAQAEAIGERLSMEPFDVLIASDLGRAQQTAQAIAARCGLPVLGDEQLRERSFGDGEGLTYPEIDARWPNVFTRLNDVVDPDAVIPGGETRRQFQERVHRAFVRMAREHEGRRVAVVCHGGVLSAIYRVIHGIPVSQAHSIKITNASYNALAFEADAWSIEAWDDIAHLPGVEPFVES